MSLFDLMKKPRRRKSRRGEARPRGEPKLTGGGGNASAAKESGVSPRAHKPRHVKQQRVRKRKGWGMKLPSWRVVATRLLGLFLTMTIIGMIVILYFAHDLPDISKLNQFVKAPSITIYAEDGTVLAAYGDVFGEKIDYAHLPRQLVEAVIATEDRRFFSHFGVDPMGVLRAAVANMRAGKLVQGGSTITQQVAKNVFLTSERTFKRKIQETMLALWLESKFTKEEILTIYLNRVYMGAGTFGVDAAAHRYFDKSGRDLTLIESAMLAGMLKAPSRYAPTNNPELAKKRAMQVLVNMHDAGYLSDAQLAAVKNNFAAATEMTTAANAQNTMYFTDWVVDQLPDYVGTVEEDLEVTTTFDLKAQGLAETAVEKILAEAGEEHHAAQAAVVSMTPEGKIRAMVGGRDYRGSQFNRAAQAMRQPGSSFKLFVYLAAIEAGFVPDSMVIDQPIQIGKWRPQNYGGKYEGAVSLRQAFAESINTVAVQLSETIGRQRVIEMARRLGISSQLNPDPSIALGAAEATLLDMTAAYAHLASGGKAVYPYAIVTIRKKSGDVLYERTGSGVGYVLGQGTVGMMDDLLQAVVEGGTGRGAAIGRPVAGKTGTSQDFRDAWFIGFVPQLVTGVWVGNDDNSPMKKITGGSLPARIWHDFMQPEMEGVAVAGIARDAGPEGSGQPLPWMEQFERLEQGGAPPGGQWQPENRPSAEDAPWHDAGPEEKHYTSDPREPRRREVKLSPSFWDKLFGE